MKRFWTVVLATSMAILLLVGCGKEEEEVVKPMDEIYALVETFDYEGITYAVINNEVGKREVAVYDSNNVGIMLKINSPGGTVYESDEVYLAFETFMISCTSPQYEITIFHCN